MFWTISIQQRNKTKQARLFELAFAVYGAAFPISARKTSIVSESHAEVNSSNFSVLEHSLCLSAHKHNQEKGLDSQGRERDFFSFPSLSRFGDVWRGYLRKSSPFTSFSPTFGKQTTKFELLFQFRKTESYQPSAAAYGKAVPSRPSHLRSAS